MFKREFFRHESMEKKEVEVLVGKYDHELM